MDVLGGLVCLDCLPLSGMVLLIFSTFGEREVEANEPVILLHDCNSGLRSLKMSPVHEYSKDNCENQLDFCIIKIDKLILVLGREK